MLLMYGHLKIYLSVQVSDYFADLGNPESLDMLSLYYVIMTILQYFL
jgi:hypothetical protein